MQTLLLKYYAEAVRQATYIICELGTKSGYLEVVECNVSSELLAAINEEALNLPIEARFTLCNKLAKAYYNEYKTYNIFEGEQAFILYHLSKPEQMILEAIALAAWHGKNIF